MKRIRFIINPRSGTGGKAALPDLIHSVLKGSEWSPEVVFTRHAGHAIELAREAAAIGYDAVVAVGGDGSVNETASSLKGTKTALGIIPTGSGNGMALHLGLPVQPEKALEVIMQGHIESIDTLLVNEKFCIGTIGVGFDAHIAHLFSRAAKRGYSTYVKLVLTEFASYGDKRFVIVADGKTFEKDCFLLTLANSSQFGNNAVIAPFADEKDGIIEISIMRKFPFYLAPALIYRLMHNTIHRSKYFECLKAKEILVRNNHELAGHIDGEPVLFSGDLKISVVPLSLKVLVPFK